MRNFQVIKVSLQSHKQDCGLCLTGFKIYIYGKDTVPTAVLNIKKVNLKFVSLLTVYRSDWLKTTVFAGV